MTPLPNSLAARDIAYYFHPATNARRHEQVGPMMIERGQGVYVFDDQGKEYIEGLAGLWSVAVGFGEPRLAAAAAAQMQKLPFYHSFSHKSHPAATALAERLVKMAPGKMAKAHFTSSGSEANDLADQADLVFQQRARPAAEEEDRLPPARLSRRHHRLGQPDRPAGVPSRFRSAAADDAPCVVPQSLALRPARRKRRGVLDAPRRRTRGADPRRRAGRPSPRSSASL